MPTFDFSASPHQKVLIPVFSNIQNHMVYFRYSYSSVFNEYQEIQISPVVMDGQNIVVVLPDFNSSLYYRLISKRLGQYYYHQNGQISYVLSNENSGGALGPNTVSTNEIINNTIRNEDISTTAAIAPTKVAGTAAVVNQLPKFTVSTENIGILHIDFTNI